MEEKDIGERDTDDEQEKAEHQQENINSVSNQSPQKEESKSINESINKKEALKNSPAHPSNLVDSFRITVLSLFLNSTGSIPIPMYSYSLYLL